MQDSSIEWTHHTFNPWRGCTKVSAGCRNCYAENQDRRFGGDHWGAGKPRMTHGVEHWKEPFRWDRRAQAKNARHRVFCGSMCDVFDAEGYSNERVKLWRIVRATPNLDWLLLTKRPENIASMLPVDWGMGYPNVWLGATVENAEMAALRVPILQELPAAIRFLSVEPLLEPIDHLPLGGIDWAIVGGESGARARPMQLEWARSIRDQCVAAGVAFFFKQWGTFGLDESGEHLVRLGKKHAGRLLDNRTWDEFPDAQPNRAA